MDIEGINIERLVHDCFRIKVNNKVLYIDPFQLDVSEEDADIILITHGHYDHCSIEDLANIIKEGTIIVATSDCLSKLTKFEKCKIKIVKPDQEIIADGIKIRTMPAYNTNKFRSPGQLCHPKEEEWIGYIIEINGKRLYHMGDTDPIEEMNNIKADVILIPVSGTYVMTAEEAADLIKKLKPKAAIPMHYGAIIGSRDDAEKFKELAKDIRVEIL